MSTGARVAVTQLEQVRALVAAIELAQAEYAALPYAPQWTLEGATATACRNALVDARATAGLLLEHCEDGARHQWQREA